MMIGKKIDQNGGTLSFHNFMHLALYSPMYGYYSGNKEKIGTGGDFITAPALSPLFGQSFARVFQPILQNLGENACIVEYGAGYGQFALDCLKALQHLNRLPKQYIIIETSANLMKAQKTLLHQKLPEYYHRIHWCQEIPQNCTSAVVFANEVLDAMPVELFQYRKGKFSQKRVKKTPDGQFAFTDQDVQDERLKAALKATGVAVLDVDEIYTSEVNLWLKPWLKSIQTRLEKCVLFVCDYGYHQALYYQKERSCGTLRCYYRHHVHDNPLIYAGVQDITAHVDFTALIEAGVSLDFELEGYATQGSFLIEAGITKCYRTACESQGDKQKLILSQHLKQLTLGSNFAENFKVMALSLDYPHEIKEFGRIDLSYLL